MVNDLLDFAKLKHSDTPLEKSVVNLRESVAHALAICQTGVGEKSLRLLNEIQDEKLLVNANADRLQQILCNLINNAIKFSEVGVIRVSALLDAEHRVRIVVSDNGVGISPADQHRIFEPFEQVDGSLSRRHEGAGLGLAICRRLVELHGGQIGVQSTPGLGSQFWFTLSRA
jgi:two-component system sensor histidine kinase ChiS